MHILTVRLSFFTKIVLYSEQINYLLSDSGRCPRNAGEIPDGLPDRARTVAAWLQLSDLTEFAVIKSVKSNIVSNLHLTCSEYGL